MTTRTILLPSSEITDDTTIHTTDLTPEGIQFMKDVQIKWLKKVDNGMPPEDVTMLEKGLRKIRAKK